MFILTSTYTILKDLMKKSYLLENSFLVQQKRKTQTFLKRLLDPKKLSCLDPCHYFSFP